MSEYFANLVDYLLHEKNPRPSPAEKLSRLESRMSVQIGGGKRWRRNPVSVGARPTSILGCRVADESVASEWGRSGRGYSFPFACVSEHTRFAEATEMNRVQ